MIVRMYAVKDELNGFAFPVPITNDRDARGWFQDKLASNRTMAANAWDYSLWYLGTFDTESGTFIHGADGIKEVMKGAERDERNDSK